MPYQRDYTTTSFDRKRKRIANMYESASNLIIQQTQSNEVAQMTNSSLVTISNSAVPLQTHTVPSNFSHTELNENQQFSLPSQTNVLETRGSSSIAHTTGHPAKHTLHPLSTDNARLVSPAVITSKITDPISIADHASNQYSLAQGQNYTVNSSIHDTQYLFPNMHNFHNGEKFRTDNTSLLSNTNRTVILELVRNITVCDATDDCELLHFLKKISRLFLISPGSDSEIIKILLPLTKGQLFHLWIDSISKNFNWEKLHVTLLETFFPDSKYRRTAHTYFERHQRLNEDFPSFVEDIIETHEILKLEWKEVEIIQLILDNMIPQLRSFILFESKPTTFSDLRKFAIQLKGRHENDQNFYQSNNLQPPHTHSFLRTPIHQLPYNYVNTNYSHHPHRQTLSRNLPQPRHFENTNTYEYRNTPQYNRYNNNRPYCTFCNIQGHTTNMCRRKQNLNGRGNY